MEQPQTQTIEYNSLAIKALWYAWRHPHLNRHQATIKRLNNPTVDKAYAAVLMAVNGEIPVEEILKLDYAAIAMLDYVDGYHVKAEKPETTQRIINTPPSELAKDIFNSPTAVMSLPTAFETAGIGDWPSVPKATPDNKNCLGSAITIRYVPKENHFTGQIAARWSRAWETDMREYHFRVRREVEKAHAEMVKQPLFYQYATRQQLDRLKMAWKKRSQRNSNFSAIYQAYPYQTEEAADVFYVVVSNVEKAATGEIPANREAAYMLFKNWLRTPEGCHLKEHSNGYGKHFQGMKGDGRTKLAQQQTAEIDTEQEKEPRNLLQLLTDIKPDEVMQLLKLDGKTFRIDNLKEFAHQLRMNVPNIKAKNGGAAWHEIAEFARMSTGKAYKKDDLCMYPQPVDILLSTAENDTSEEQLDSILGATK